MLIAWTIIGVRLLDPLKTGLVLHGAGITVDLYSGLLFVSSASE